MNTMPEPDCPPALLIVAGNDPSGGAGLCADIQTASRFGTHPVPIVASVTVQDTRDVTSASHVDQALLAAQLDAVLGDLRRVHAIKLGLLGTVEQVRIVASTLRRLDPCPPVVLDPVLKAGGGGRLAGETQAEALAGTLVPLATVTTPNRYELACLVPGEHDVQAAAVALARRSGTCVLATGADEAAACDAPVVSNLAASPDGSVRRWEWPRLPARYHGSGCTLAAALAALLARGEPLESALHEAQAYTHRSLAAGFAPGRGQLVPRRMVD